MYRHGLRSRNDMDLGGDSRLRGSDKRLTFIQGDIRDRDLMRLVFERFEISAVMHFAGLKAVGESVAKPLMYYDNNVSGSVALFEVMAELGYKRVPCVFSSLATVYGDPASVPTRRMPMKRWAGKRSLI